MFDDWYRPNARLEFPKGGSGALIDALVRGLEKHGGRLELNAHVDEILVEGGRAAGVRLRDGSKVAAGRAVVSNATKWDTVPLLPADVAEESGLRPEADATGQCESFMHLHLGIDATGLPDDLEMHHIVVNDWEAGITAPQNLCLVSIPSVIDPTMAPEGKHVIHAYTPGNEPYSLWEGMDRKSPEYKALKEERAQVLWRAVEKVIPDVRSRVEIEMVGTPLTCERFLRRTRGTYGGTVWVGGDAGLGIPSPATKLEGLFCVGDSAFPGPGVPSVAAGGLICANTIGSVWQQLDGLKKVAV